MEMPEGFKKFDKLYAKDGELTRKASDLLKEMAEALEYYADIDLEFLAKFPDSPVPKALPVLKKFKGWK